MKSSFRNGEKGKTMPRKTAEIVHNGEQLKTNLAIYLFSHHALSCSKKKRVVQLWNG